MEIAWLCRLSCFRVPVSALILYAISFGNSPTLLAQSVFAPFPPPPSAPGISWPPETLKNLKTLESYLERAAKIGNGKLYSQIALNIGNLHGSVSDWGVALEYYKRGLDAAIMAKDEDDEASILGNMGTAYAKLGQVQEAATCLNKALDLQRGLLASSRTQSSQDVVKHLRQNEEVTLNSLGNLYLVQQQYSKALDSFNREMSTAQAAGDVKQQANATMNLGLVYHEMGDIQNGFDLVQRSLLLFEQDNNKAGEAHG